MDRFVYAVSPGLTASRGRVRQLVEEKRATAGQPFRDLFSRDAGRGVSPGRTRGLPGESWSRYSK